MFRTIRRLIILLLLALLAYAGWWAYQERARLLTLLDAGWILYHEAQGLNEPPRPRTLLSGQVTRVIDGNWFSFRPTNGLVYVFKQAAAEAPVVKSPLNPRGDPLGLESATNLSRLILSNEVVIDVLHCDERRYGQGYVYLNGTNVGVPLAEAGLAKVSRAHIKPLPFREQFALLSAERKARVTKVGMWQHTED